MDTTEYKTVVIAFTGAARSGKDTAARAVHHYVNSYNDSTAEFTDCYVMGYESFAGPIKSMVAMMLDFFGLGEITKPETLVEYIEGSKKEENIEAVGASPRKLMQTLGTDWGRKMIHPDVWINSMLARLNNYKAAKDMGYKGAVVAITDVRYDNEAEALHKIGAKIVHIVKPDVVGVLEHESEAGINPALVDFTVVNDGGVEDLRKKVYDVLAGVLPLSSFNLSDTDELPWEEESNDDAAEEERSASHS